MTENELLDKLVEVIGNPLESEVYDEDKIRVIQAMAAIEGIQELFRAMMGKDMRLYWQAADDVSRANAKGGFGRLAYLRGLMKNADTLVAGTKLAQKRTKVA